MLILLTGAFGNIGSHTAPELLRQGHRIRCFDQPTATNRRQARRLPRGVEVIWGDIRDAADMAAAVHGVDTVVHLAALIPPASEEQPHLARTINVDGTRNIIIAATASENRPRLLFASTLNVHGHTLSKPPPRRVHDPLSPTDAYTSHKIACEEMVRASGLIWCILRFAVVPILGLRPAHRTMFEIGPDNRLETLHPDDAGLAIANALNTPEVWNRVHFIGGGASCQLTYRQYMTATLAAMGIKPLPDNAFSDKEYATDWLDTENSQRLLRYQRYAFPDIAAAIAASLGWRRPVIRLIGPLARAAILKMSPYAPFCSDTRRHSPQRRGL